MTPKRWLLLGSFLLSLLVLSYEYLYVPPSSQFYLDLTQYYGFICTGFLFAVLFPGPFYRLFPMAPWAIKHRAYLAGLGISTFYFALLHSTIAFWGLLQGFGGIRYLPTVYFWGMVLGFLALLILATLAGTSFDYARKRLGTNWKRLHRSVYAAGFLSAGHIAMAGSHFQSLTNFVPTFWMLAFFALIVMHAIALNRLLASKYPTFTRLFFPINITLVIVLCLFILNFLHTYAHSSHMH